MDRGTRDFLLRYSGADLQVLVKVLGDLAGAHKDGVRLVPPDRPALSHLFEETESPSG